jgi:peptidoglycan/LPS O-acetylase OafA/YrhL
MIYYYFNTYIFNPVWTHINFELLGRFKKLEWNSWIVKAPLYTYLSILVASLSYRYVEMPILKLKDRFFKY